MELAKLAESLDGNGTGDNARLPKYVRLSEGIIHSIEAGELEVGDRLPSEAELASLLPASLGTIQKALGVLAERGVLVRRHGLGTFVAERRMAPDDLWHFRFLGDDGQSLLPVYTTVSAIERVPGNGPWAEFLGAEPFYIAVHRLIDVNHEFLAAGVLYLAGPRFEGLLETDPGSLDGVSIRAVMRGRFDVPTLRVRTQVACEALSAADCRTLGLGPGTAGLICRILGYGYKDAPVSFQQVAVPPNGRRLDIHEPST